MKMSATAAAKALAELDEDTATVVAALVDAGHLTRSNATDIRTGRIAWQTAATLAEAGLAELDKRDGVRVTVHPTDKATAIVEALR